MMHCCRTPFEQRLADEAGLLREKAKKPTARSRARRANPQGSSSRDRIASHRVADVSVADVRQMSGYRACVMGDDWASHLLPNLRLRQRCGRCHLGAADDRQQRRRALVRRALCDLA